MAKRSTESTRRVRATLAVPSAKRRRGGHELSESASLAAQRASAAGAASVFASPGTSVDGGDPAEPIGVAGTQNMWGYITGEDYNPDLDGYPMFAKYDQMRRGDAQVSAALLQIKLPFKAARKMIKPASDDPEDKAIADFVTECLLSEQAMKRPFESVLDHLMLRFDFGCSAEEIIWEIGEGGELRFKDLAPRLPRTFYRWVEHETGPTAGELKFLQQFAPKYGRYGFFNIPAERLVLHAHRKEGNNYYGMALLRAAYPNWFWKQQLYRIDAIRHDRLGAGIFVARIGKDYSANSAPLDKIEDTLRGLRSHDQAFAVIPYGVDYDILVPKNGESQTTGLIESIEHHNQMIAASVLQQFSTQGQQKHGSLGQAKVTHDVFLDALEGQGVEMGSEISDGAIHPLCDANFDMRGRAYPLLVFADIASADVSMISESMSKLATAGLVTPDDDLENWMRELHDAPAMPEEIKGRSRIRVPAMPGAPPVAGAPDTPPSPTPAKPEGQPVPVDAATRTPFLELGRRFSREPSAFERACFDLHGVPSELEQQQQLLVRTLAGVRRDQLKAVAASLAKKDGRKSTAAFTDIRHAYIKMPKTGELVKAIRKAQDRALAFGRTSVRKELSKQGAMVPTEAALELVGDTSATTRRSTTSTLVSSAQITARKQSENWLARIMDEGLRLRRTGLRGTELEEAILANLEDDAESGAKRDAAQEINEAFGLGRAGAARDLDELIEEAEYSAILDANTCDPCQELDGEVFKVDSQEYDENLPPNRNCDGKDNCRCVYLYRVVTPAEVE